MAKPQKCVVEYFKITFYSYFKMDKTFFFNFSYTSYDIFYSSNWIRPFCLEDFVCMNVLVYVFVKEDWKDIIILWTEGCHVIVVLPLKLLLKIAYCSKRIEWLQDV